MLKKFFAALMAMFVATQMAVAATSPEKQADAIAMVERGVALFEAEGMDALAAAALDQNNTDFFQGELYVIAFDYDGNCIIHGANPKLVGKNLGAVKDPTGLAINDAMEEVALGQGSGWVDYQWTNPVTNKVASKTTYVQDLGNGTFIGVGFYK